MLTSVFGKTLYDQRRSLPAWAVSLALLVGMYVVVWPSVRGQPTMRDFLDQMPAAFRSMFASTGADMSTAVGFVQVELMSLLGPIAVVVYGIAAGGSAVAGEEDRHTIGLLLANQVSRTSLVLQKFAALLLGTFVLTAVLGLALVVEGSWADMGLPVGKVAAAMLHMTLLGLVFGTLALALSAATGSLALGRWVSAALAVVAYAVNGLAPLVDQLRHVQGLSPFYQYIGHDPLRTGVAWDSVGIATATVLVLLGVALAGFSRRDVAG